MARRDLSRRIRQRVRRAEIAGHHLQATRQRIPRRDAFAARETRRRRCLVLDQNRDPFECRSGLRRWCFQFAILPRTHRRADHDLLEFRRPEAVGNENRHRGRIEPVRTPSRQLRRALERRTTVGDRTHADQQHAFRTAVAAGEVQDLVAIAHECAACERSRDRAAERCVERGESVRYAGSFRAEHGQYADGEDAWIGANDRKRE